MAGNVSKHDCISLSKRSGGEDAPRVARTEKVDLTEEWGSVVGGTSTPTEEVSVGKKTSCLPPTEKEALARASSMERNENKVGTAAWGMDVDGKVALKEHACGWDDLEKEREEMMKLKQSMSPGSKRWTGEGSVRRASIKKRVLEQESDVMGDSENKDGKIYDTVNKEQVVVVDGDILESVEGIPTEPRGVRKQRRKSVRRLLLSETMEKEQSMYLEKEVREKSADAEEFNGDAKLKEDAFHCRALRTISDGDSTTVFFDFESYKSSLFVRKGEVWAMYDERGMPRRYAKVLENGYCYSANVRFLRFNEADMKKWYEESGALRACGQFVPCSLASSWASRCDSTAFSHKLLGWEDEDRWKYEIYPRKGEIWAITTGSNSTPFHMGSPTLQKYHIVEVLEDYNIHTGAKVGYLAMVEGSHSSLFQRRLDETDSFYSCIPPKDVTRFSHQIPFFQIAEGRFSGCIELDPASLPRHIGSVTASSENGIDETYLAIGLLDLKISWHQLEFRHDTVWAVYDDCTRMPQKYVAIQYLYKPNPESRIKISLLKPYHSSENERKQRDASLPVVCGNFVLDDAFDTSCNIVYSHPVAFELEPRPCGYDLYMYKIYPKEGDIWGIYKNSDVKGNCNLSRLWRKLQYEIVEIVRKHSSGKGIEVRKLVRIEGLKWIFKRERTIIMIPMNEFYRFSHQIPAYKFELEQTDERLKGSIILDPMLVPETERDYFTFGDSSLLETLKLKPLHVSLEYLTGKGKFLLRNNEAKCRQSEHLRFELKHLEEFQSSDGNEGIEAGGTAMRKLHYQILGMKLEDSKSKIEEPILSQPSTSLSVAATHEPTLFPPLFPDKSYSWNKDVKPNTTPQEGKAVSLRSSTHTEEVLMSSCNVNHEVEGNPRRTNEKQCLLDRLNVSEDILLLTKSRAEKIQSDLDPSLPSLLKPMKPSHVSSGFWLGLPAKFCKLHMPEHDCSVALVDEDGKAFEAIYLAKKTGLSGGWRGFCIAHQLVVGDALIFQLVQSTTFKVYIIRASSSGASGGIQPLQNKQL